MVRLGHPGTVLTSTISDRDVHVGTVAVNMVALDDVTVTPTVEPFTVSAKSCKLLPSAAVILSVVTMTALAISPGVVNVAVLLMLAAVISAVGHAAITWNDLSAGHDGDVKSTFNI